MPTRFDTQWVKSPHHILYAYSPLTNDAIIIIMQQVFQSVINDQMWRSHTNNSWKSTKWSENASSVLVMHIWLTLSNWSSTSACISCSFSDACEMMCELRASYFVSSSLLRLPFKKSRPRLLSRRNIRSFFRTRRLEMYWMPLQAQWSDLQSYCLFHSKMGQVVPPSEPALGSAACQTAIHCPWVSLPEETAPHCGLTGA